MFFNAYRPTTEELSMSHKRSLRNFQRIVGNKTYHVNFEQIMPSGGSIVRKYIVSFSVSKKYFGLFSKIINQSVHCVDLDALNSNGKDAKNIDTQLGIDNSYESLNAMFEFYMTHILGIVGLTDDAVAEVATTEGNIPSASQFILGNNNANGVKEPSAAVAKKSVFRMDFQNRILS